MDNSIDIKQIFRFLPHRYPFLLVDRILAWEPGKKITALKNVSINEPFFQGHFPGAPIMPGVLIIEALAQAGGVLFMANREKVSEKTLMYFMGMDKVKFRRQVVPGDQLILEVNIVKLRAKVIKLAGIAKVDGQVAAEAELMATFEE